jgi:hypothetical protein
MSSSPRFTACSSGCARQSTGAWRTPTLFSRSPFHRFGVRMNKTAEAVRDRRVSREEEKRLLDTALGVMNTASHQYVGELLHDRIVGAPELCSRWGEMLLIQNKRVNWDTCQIGIPGATAKDKENRRIRSTRTDGSRPCCSGARHSDQTCTSSAASTASISRRFKTAWETLKLLANGLTPKTGKEGPDWNAEQLRRIDLRWHHVRHEGACRLLADGVDIASSR